MLNREDEIFKTFLKLKDHPKYAVNPLGEIKNVKTGRILKPDTSYGGYCKVELDGKKYYIHRLVAESFIPKESGDRFVLHKNGDKSDNFYGNLKWSCERKKF